VKSSIVKLLMHGRCSQTTCTDANFLVLSLPLFMVEVAEAAIISILASALCMKTAATAQPSKMPK